MQLLLDAAAKNNNIDISDNIFDWTLKAVILKKYPNVYRKVLASQYDKKTNRFSNKNFLDSKGKLIVPIKEHLMKKIRADAK